MILCYGETRTVRDNKDRITKAKTDSVISFQPLKMLLGRSMLQQLADMKGCKSIEEYIMTYELPEEMHKALRELMQKSERNTGYIKNG